MTSAHDRLGRGADRRNFLYLATATMAGGGAALAAWPLIDQFNPAADVPSLTFGLGVIPVGGQRIIIINKKPVFLRHRTPSEIAAAIADDHERMREPELDAQRVKAGHANLLIVEGFCTFDHCIVSKGGGRFGGWSCPCCGAHYDMSGRAREGPPEIPGRSLKNLTVPKYEFVTGRKIRFAYSA